MHASDHVTSVIDELLYFPEVNDRLVLVVDLFYECVGLELTALRHCVELQLLYQEEFPQHFMRGKGWVS